MENRIFPSTRIFNGVRITTIDNRKHLGLTLDSKLTFDHHVNEKIAIARKGIGIINYLFIFIPVKILDQIYKIFVRSHLDYCDVITTFHLLLTRLIPRCAYLLL